MVLIDAQGEEEEFPLLSKSEVAGRVWDRIEQLCSLKAMHGETE